jgi:16S rRNA processing protein RimM
VSDDLVPVGRVGRPHGLDGAFVVERPSDDPRRYEVDAVLHVDGVPAKVVLSRRVGGGRRAIKLDRPVERGAQLTVPRADLPPPEPDSYYVFQIVGLAVVADDGRDLGTVKDVMPGVANDNLELSSGALVPMIEDAIVSIDLEEGRIVLNSNFIE